jgi:hypothetical protein
MHQWVRLHNLCHIAVINRHFRTWVTWVLRQLHHQGLLGPRSAILVETIERIHQAEEAEVEVLLAVGTNVVILLHFQRPRRLQKLPSKSGLRLVSNSQFLELPVHPQNRTVLPEMIRRRRGIMLPQGLVYVLEVRAMVEAKAWLSAPIHEVVRPCGVEGHSNFLQCRQLRMQALQAKVKAKGTTSRDEEVQLDTTETRRGTSRAIGETSLNSHRRISKVKWATSRANSNNKVASSLAIVTVAL